MSGCLLAGSTRMLPMMTVTASSDTQAYSKLGYQPIGQQTIADLQGTSPGSIWQMNVKAEQIRIIQIMHIHLNL